MKFIRNPVTRRRLARFKSMKRAYISFWLLAGLYGLSLISELLCNGVPLYIQFKGSAYFPVFQYYSEDVFTGNGKKTRPDYKALSQMPVFSEEPDNFMFFAPHPYGPLESVKPETIPVANEVRLHFKPVPRVGTVDIGEDLTVVAARYFEFFTGKGAKMEAGDELTRYFDFPDAFFQALSKRFSNQSAPYKTVVAENRQGDEFNVALSTYRPRPTPPDSIRLIFREPAARSDDAAQAVFGPNLEMRESPPALWEKVDSDAREVLKSMVALRFEAPVEDYRVVVGGRQFVASFEKTDVRFPFPPVRGHPLGIDAAGRDVLARILYGLRIALTFGLLLVGGSMTLGIAAGAVQGYYGGKFDITAQRVIEVWNALPFLYVMILMGSIYGRSFELLLIIYGLFNWIGISYYIRAEFLNLRKRPFVEAARCMGVPTRKMIFKHILPNALVPVVTFFPFSLVGAIGALAALDYLGFGLPPPTPSWGEMLFEAQQYRWAWWLILYPSIALFTVMLLGVFVGEGIRNAYDPKEFSRME